MVHDKRGIVFRKEAIMPTAGFGFIVHQGNTKDPDPDRFWAFSGGGSTLFTPAPASLAENVTGTGQARGNSGVFLASTGPGDAGYELQVLDNYNNKTYVNGQAGSIYKQAIPLANPNRKPGEWQTYDIAWTAPVFNDDGSVKSPAYVTVFFNGVLVQNHFELKGETRYIGQPFYKKFDGAPIKLQAHGDPSPPLSFRNIWVRELN